MPKIGRNEPCPCGSGLKYKRCHGNPGFNILAMQAAKDKMTELIAKELERRNRKEAVILDEFAGVDSGDVMKSAYNNLKEKENESN